MAQMKDGLQELKTVESGIDNNTATGTVRETKGVGTDNLATLYTGYTESDIVADLPPAEGKRALRKIDFRLVPLLEVLYLVAFIDRSNV